MEWTAHLHVVPLSSQQKYAAVDGNDSDANSGNGESTNGDPSAKVDATFAQMASVTCSALMLFLCAFGTVGNTLSVYVFTRRSMRSSINVLLTGLSIIDLWVLLIAIVVFVVPGLNTYKPFGEMVGLQFALLFGVYQLGMVAQTCSVWIFVIISFERFLAVCRPLYVHQIMTVRKAKIALLCVALFALAYNAVRFWEYQIVYQRPGTDNETNITIVKYAYLLRIEPTYFIVYYTAMYMMVHFFIPFFFIITLNGHIIKAIAAADHVRFTILTQKISQTHHNEKCENRRDEKQQRQTTRMIIVVTVIFAICNMLPFVLNFWEALDQQLFFDESPGGYYVLATVTLDTANLLIVANSSINCVIYWIYCRRYRLISRETFRALTKIRCNVRKNTTSSACSGDSAFLQIDEDCKPLHTTTSRV